MGQALSGFSPGGLPFGYRSTGSEEEGYKRHIHEPEAQWVRHIFGRYVLGDSPRKIAQSLNEKGVASSRGGTWAHTALYPDVKGVGMLGNPMYAGRPVWNRTKWLHHPVSGKRVRTMRPESEWVITEDPALRIIDEDVWHATCARVESQRHGTSDRKTATGKSSGGRSPKYLFSSLLRCGTCGAAYVMVDRSQYGCSYNRDRGASVCANSMRVVTDRRNGATDVRRIGASNRWVNGRPEGVTPGWILQAFAGLVWWFLAAAWACGTTARRAPGSRRCDAAGPGWRWPAGGWPGRPDPTRGSPGCW